MTVRAAMVPGRGAVVYSLADLAGAYADLAGPTQTYAVDIRVKSTGDVDVFRDQAADLTDEAIWILPQGLAPNGTFCRFHRNSGEMPSAGSDTFEVWNSLASTRNAILRHTSGGGDDSVTMNIDIEIATDSGGTDIVAQKLGIILDAGEIF